MLTARILPAKGISCCPCESWTHYFLVLEPQRSLSPPRKSPGLAIWFFLSENSLLLLRYVGSVAPVGYLR